jgi:hypothetical protein
MTRGTIKTREYFVACRQDKTRLESLIETAQYKGMTIRETTDALGLTLTDTEENKLRELGINLV